MPAYYGHSSGTESGTGIDEGLRRSLQGVLRSVQTLICDEGVTNVQLVQHSGENSYSLLPGVERMFIQLSETGFLYPVRK